MKSFCGLLLTLVAVNGALLGTNKCTYGPSYWCASLQNSRECIKTQHCLVNVWQNKKSETSQLSLIKEGTACTFCKDIVQDVRDFLVKDATWDEIREYMKEACGLLPDDYSRKTCNDITEHYLEEFITLVNTTLDAEQVCELVRLCPPPSSAVVAQQSLQPSLLRSEKAGEFCDDCKAAVAKLKAEIEDKQNQAKVKQMLEDLCQKYGGDYATECKAAVEMMFAEVIQAIDDQLTDDLCVKLHLCDSQVAEIDISAFAKAAFMKLAKVNSLKQYISMKSNDGNLGDACATCEQIINYVKIFVGNNETKQEVKDLLENDLCTELGELSSMCKEAVEQYFPELWAEFLKVLDPKTLCTDIGLCTSGPAAPALPKVKASVQCVLCEFVMDKLKSMISDETTEDEIIKDVEKVCSILPSSIRDECDSLIEKYGKVIIHLLVSDVSSETICATIGLCGLGDSLYMKPLNAVTTDNCMMCELAISYVKSMLAKNETLQEIENMLDKVCNYLSGEMSQQCNTMVDQYAPSLVKMLVEDLDGKQICARLGLCKSQADGLVYLYKGRPGIN